MRKNRIILSRPAYHHVIFDLHPEAPPLNLGEIHRFQELLVAASNYHDMPLVAYSIGPAGAHALILDREPSSISLREALALDGALSPASAAIAWRKAFEQGGKLSPGNRATAERILKRRGGLVSYGRTVKTRFPGKVGRALSPTLWPDRFRSHPVQTDPRVVAGVMVFVWSHDANCLPRGSKKNHLSSLAAAETGDRSLRAAMAAALGCRDWKAARTLLKSVEKSGPALSRRADGRGGARPEYGELTKSQIAAAKTRSAKRRVDRSETEARFKKMLAIWKTYVTKRRAGPEKLDLELLQWMRWIREKKGHRKLRQEWEAALNALDFPWTSSVPGKRRGRVAYEFTVAALQWRRQLADLQEYQRLHGKGSIPPIHSRLGRWISGQRRRKEKGTLRDWQSKALASMIP